MQRIQRIFIIIGFITFLALGLRVAPLLGIDLSFIGSRFQAVLMVAGNSPHVALISGHAGSDSGAICTADDGQVQLTEADVNATITELVAQRLRAAGFTTTVLDEMDTQLTGLSVDVLISLHSDSCVALSGYKATHRANSPILAREAHLIACIDQHYSAATNLIYHPDTLTHDMLGYHAFNRIHPETPAAILEMGFLGGDQHLLVDEPARVAQGIVASILCFLQDDPEGTLDEASSTTAQRAT